MTATMVDQIKVVRDEPTRAPFKNRDDQPVLWQQTRTLTLADGRVVYGCLHCAYTSPNRNSIRPHLGAHNRLKVAKAAPANVKVGELSINQLLTLAEENAALITKVATLAEQSATWKQRALDAEGRLKKMRSALGVA